MNPGNSDKSSVSRRSFFKSLAAAGVSIGVLRSGDQIFSQEAGERPKKSELITALNPRCRVPVGLIIDDSTCLVNLNRFAMPQFDAAHKGKNPIYKRDWKKWPLEIPDSFVRKFGEWCAENGVKGKYSVVPYPACVGRLDRLLPGWSQEELEASIELVRNLMIPNWDIHPEMVTHTRVIDLKTGHPYPEISLKYMENWDWTTGKSAEEIADYMAYALTILKNVGLYCEGITTPGGFGNRARPQLAKATLDAVRGVFNAEIPHYFRDLYDSGNRSVAPRVELASGIDSNDPKCVVSIIGCTGDWTGGWDCVEPEGADRFISSDLSSGRMVDVISRGEPAYMVCHWTGIYWNGEEKGFKVFQEVVKRLKSRFENLIWMKLSELARYWAAKELTSFEIGEDFIKIKAPFACPDFTIFVKTQNQIPASLEFENKRESFKEVNSTRFIQSRQWAKENSGWTLCFDLPKGNSIIRLKKA